MEGCANSDITTFNIAVAGAIRAIDGRRRQGREHGHPDITFIGETAHTRLPAGFFTVERDILVTGKSREIRKDDGTGHASVADGSGFFDCEDEQSCPPRRLRNGIFVSALNLQSR